MMKKWILLAVVVVVGGLGIYLYGFSSRSGGDRIGSVSTTWHFLNNDKISTDGYDDPRVPGIALYLSRARAGGISGAVGTAEDPSEMALSCVRYGKVVVPDNIADYESEKVLTERASILFKTIEVYRQYDPKRHVLVYVTISTKIINGSPAVAQCAIALDNSPS
jgi:CreA protein